MQLIWRPRNNQRLDLGRDHGEASTSLAGARRFDRGIQRQQIRLLGNSADQIDDAVDLFGSVRKPGDIGARPFDERARGGHRS